MSSWRGSARIGVLFLLLLATGTTFGAVSLRGPVALDVSDNGVWAVVAFQKDDSVAIVDLSASPYGVTDLRAADGIGRRPVAVRCVNQTAIVLHEFDTKLSIVDLPTATVISQVELPMYAQDVVWDAASNRFFVSNAALDRVHVYDDLWSPIGPVDGLATGRSPGPLTLGPNGRLYVGNRRSWDVSVIAVDDPNPALWGEVGRVFLGSRPEDLASSANTVFVTHHGGSNLTTLNGIPQILDDQSEIRNVLTEIDPLTLQTTDRFIDLGADYAGIDIDAGMLAVAGAGSGTVHVASLTGLGTVETIDLLLDGSLPGAHGPGGLRVFAHTRDVAIHPSGSVFAVNHLRDSLVELRALAGPLEVYGETALNPAGVPITAFEPPGPAVNFNEVQQGQRYLHTIAAWKRGQRDFTCATCHPDGDTDRRALHDDRDDPFGLPGQAQGSETMPSLAALVQTAPFGWEALQVPLSTFNAVALNIHDVPPTPDNQGIFIDVAHTIERFETNIRPGPSPFLANEAGRELFANKAGCAICHVPPIYTDNNIYNIGTARTVNIPPLVGVWNRGPYLHDGRAATVEDLLDNATYDTPNRHGHLQVLSAQEKRDLSAFVRSLGPDVCLELVGADIDTGLRVGKAPCPPTGTRSPHTDFVRTTLDSLIATGQSIDLGPTTCLADEHEVRHLEDAADPGNVGSDLWIFLARESGPDDRYGVSSAGLPRRSAATDCAQ